MTVTIHKVTGGEGYDYLTEQVSSGDDIRYGASPDTYYERTGEQPGYWLGAGAAAKGLAGRVDHDTMKALWVAAAIRNGQRGGVAGFDFTMSPVKSVSALWAVAPQEVQGQIEAAHRAAVADTVGYLEGFAATRTGKGGAAEPAPGFVVAAFEHRVSRAGDPALHTHAAVLNRAQSPDGQWRALMHLPLYEATVAASEHYNARVEDYLVRDLGVAFEDRPRRNPDLRSTREIVGVPAELLAEFSGRRAAIEKRVAGMGLNHERSVKASARVHQWATLSTRTRKGPPRSLADRAADWRARAEAVLGRGGVDRVLSAVRRAVHRLDPRTLAEVARDVRAKATAVRARPKPLHFRAEAERQLRAHPAAIAARDQVVTMMTETVMTEPETTDAQKALARLADLGRRIREAKAPTRERQALTAAADFYRGNVQQSWVPTYMATRRLPVVDVGYAPGRESLLNHLRSRGFTDDEMLRAGLVSRTDRGQLIDRFRDRMVFPLREPSGQVVGFTARRSPADENNPRAPKYLNSPGENITGADVFRKGEVLYGLNPESAERLRQGAALLIVEGPMDAVAFDVSRETTRDPGDEIQAPANTVVVATCGTALTREHLLTLDRIAPLRGRPVVVVMDTDPAGVAAAVKAHDVLRDFGLENLYTVDGIVGDPAAVVQRDGAEALGWVWLDGEAPLYDTVVRDVLSRWDNPQGWNERKVGAMHEVAPMIAKMPIWTRDRQIATVATTMKLDFTTVANNVQRHVSREARGLPAAPTLATAGGVRSAGYDRAPAPAVTPSRGISY